MSPTDNDVEPQAPKIEFPCDYPIKVIGLASEGFEVDVITIVHRHAAKVDPEKIKVNPSKQQNYVSITVTIIATGKDQLTNLFLELKTHASVKMVL